MLNKTLIAGATGAFLLGSAAMAEEPVQLTDNQMDDVTAGFLFAFASTGGFLSEFGSAGDNGVASFEEISETSQNATSNLSDTAASSASDATAFSSIFGTFDNVSLGGIETGGTLSFNGFLPTQNVQ